MHNTWFRFCTVVRNAALHLAFFGAPVCRNRSPLQKWQLCKGNVLWGALNSRALKARQELWKPFQSSRALETLPEFWEPPELWKLFWSSGSPSKALEALPELWRPVQRSGSPFRALGALPELWEPSKALGALPELWGLCKSSGCPSRALKALRELWVRKPFQSSGGLKYTNLYM